MGAFGVIALLLAQSTAETVPWKPLTPLEGELRGGELVVRGEPGRSLLLVSLDEPNLPSHRFVLKTSVSGRLSGTAVLELVLLRNPGDQVAERFVRTVDTGGPMAKLGGDFSSRAVELPCVSDPATPPKALRISIRFDGVGEVRLQPFTIEPWPVGSLTWFAAGGAAMILGVTLGIVGGIFAVMAAVPSLRVAAYRMAGVFAVIGLCMIAASVVLYQTAWPFGIWMTIGVGGALCVIGFGGTMPLVKRAIQISNHGRRESTGTLELN